MSFYATYPGSGGGTSAAVPTYTTLSAFPSAITAGNGALAIALDTNILYESNGTSWIVLSNPANSSAITALTGDVTATGPGSVAATVASVGGSTASAVNTATVAANNATNLNTVSTIVKRDGSGNFSAGTISAALTGNVTGNVSGTAANVTGVVAVANGGTNSSTALNSNRFIVSSSSKIVEASAVTANVAVISDANGLPTSSTTTATELGYVHGVTSAIQTQLNAKQATGNYITALTGDVTASGPGSVTATLAATSNATLTTLSGLTTASALASVGTITTGTWSATTIAIGKGGTGQTTANAGFGALSPLTTKGDLVGYSTVNARLPVGTDGQVLISDSTQTLGLRWGAVVTGNVRASEGGGTVTLTSSSNPIQLFNLTAAETVVLPSTGVNKGDVWTLINPNAYALTIQASDATVISTNFGSDVTVMALSATPTTSTSWAVVSNTILYGRTATAYTPTYTTGVTVTNSKVQWQRVGSYLNIYGDLKISTLSSPTGNFTVSFPSGLTSASTNYPNGSNTAVGTCSFYRGPSTNTFTGPVWYNSTTNMVFATGYGASGTGGYGILALAANQLDLNDFFGFSASFICDQFT